MIGAYASLLLVVVASLVVGQALLALSGRRQASGLAGAVGIAALMVVAGIASRLPGHAVTAAVALVVVTAVAAAYLPGRVQGVGAGARIGVPVAVASAAAASLPFAIAGQVGVLGVGLVNDDMASHLLIADYVRDPSGDGPSFVQGGYPIGPHAVVAAAAEGLGNGLIDVFAGFTLALAPLTALVALAVLGELPPGRRALAATLASLSYLGAAYLAQGAFKEPLEALILIGFAIALADLVGLPIGTGSPGNGAGTHPVVRAVPLGVLAAGSVFNYSLPGLLWLGAVAALVLGARYLLGSHRPSLPPGGLRRLAPYGAGVLGVVALATVLEWERIADFTRLEALNPDRFGSALGNLRHAISPLEALGVWPSGEYRISATAAGAPAALFYLGAALAAVAVGIGLWRAWRSGRLALAAALVATAVVWGLASLFSTPYIAAKALAIGAPIAMILALGGLLAPGDRRRPRILLAAAFIPLAALSSFLALRQAPVGPQAHADELDRVRPVVEGEDVLFLGRDDFIAWELRGADVTGVVTNHYNVEEIRPRFRGRRGGGEKFDFDAALPSTLDQFPYILTTNGGPQSSAPPRHVPVVETPSYTLWERRGPVGRRRTLAEGAEPGAVLGCETEAERRARRGKGTAFVWRQPPVIGGARGWRPSATATHERPATQELSLTPGRWLISLEHDSRRPLEVSAPGLSERLPANLDFRGPTPYFPVGEIEVSERGPVEVTVEIGAPNGLGRLLGAPNEAHLRRLSATPVGGAERIQRREGCGRYVDWYRAR